MMVFSYGQGEYCEGPKRVKGQIVLSEHKLYLRGPEGDIAPTYVPLEKIEKVRKTRQGVEVYVRPSLVERYTALFRGERKHLASLLKDLVARRGLRKRGFWANEWVEEE